MTELRQRDPRQRDDLHLAYIRNLPCCICGSSRDVEAAHLRMRLPEIGKDTGLGEKPHDSFVTPLCAYHHRTGILAQHKISEDRFWFELHGRNPFEICARLWIESGGAARATERAQNPKPLKPRKIKARDRDAPKRKIQSRPNFPKGRPLQSRGFERRT
jgi:hypothetical protein